MPHLTEAQRRHWEAFGFLLLPQVYPPAEASRISDAFDAVLAEAAAEKDVVEAVADDALTGALIIDPGMCERHPVLAPLPEDPRVSGPVGELLGEGWFYEGSDGRIACGDTGALPAPPTRVHGEKTLTCLPPAFSLAL